VGQAVGGELDLRVLKASRTRPKERPSPAAHMKAISSAAVCSIRESDRLFVSSTFEVVRSP
jgi:hypothetical protein